MCSRADVLKSKACICQLHSALQLLAASIFLLSRNLLACTYSTNIAILQYHFIVLVIFSFHQHHGMELLPVLGVPLLPLSPVKRGEQKLFSKPTFKVHTMRYACCFLKCTNMLKHSLKYKMLQVKWIFSLIHKRCGHCNILTHCFLRIGGSKSELGVTASARPFTVLTSHPLALLLIRTSPISPFLFTILLLGFEVIKSWNILHIWLRWPFIARLHLTSPWSDLG